MYNAIKQLVIRILKQHYHFYTEYILNTTYFVKTNKNNTSD